MFISNNLFIYIPNLVSELESKEWFHSVEQDKKLNKYIIYVNYMNENVLKFIDEKFPTSFALLHFSSSLSSKDKYISNANVSKTLKSIEDDFFEIKEKCNIDNIIDIFFEIQDGDDSLTSFSNEFPEIRKKIEDMIDYYGYNRVFNLINC